MPIQLSSRIVHAENLMSAPMDNEIVILNVAGDNYIGLDEIGLRIWDYFEEPCRVDELCDRLLREFKVTPEQIRVDVLQFLEELHGEGLIRIVD